MSIYCFLIASKLLDAAKPSTAQHLTGIKCRFYLLNNFSYALQTHYEKERNIFVILDTKPNIYTKLYYLKNPVQNIANYQVLAPSHNKENISTSSFG
jgi:hypothetical protein